MVDSSRIRRYFVFAPALARQNSLLKGTLLSSFPKRFRILPATFCCGLALTIRQDDSGMPICYFTPDRWILRFSRFLHRPARAVQKSSTNQTSNTTTPQAPETVTVWIRLPMEPARGDSDPCCATIKNANCRLLVGSTGSSARLSQTKPTSGMQGPVGECDTARARI